MMQLFFYELKLEVSFNLFKSEEDPALIEIHISVGKTLTKLSDFKHAQTTLERGLKIAGQDKNLVISLHWRNLEWCVGYSQDPRRCAVAPLQSVPTMARG